MSAIDRDDISMLCFEKKTTREKYIYIFTDDQRAELLRTFGRQACNAELSFSWYDAANLSMQVRELLCREVGMVDDCDQDRHEPDEWDWTEEYGEPVG